MRLFFVSLQNQSTIFYLYFFPDPSNYNFPASKKVIIRRIGTFSSISFPFETKHLQKSSEGLERRKFLEKSVWCKWGIR